MPHYLFRAKDKPDEIKLLIKEHGINVNVAHGEALIKLMDKPQYLTYNSNYFNFFIDFIDHGANVNIRDGEPLRVALRTLNHQIIEFLIDHVSNVDINECYRHVISFETYYDDEYRKKDKNKVLDFLVSKGANDVRNIKRRKTN
jgi:hypothetical protein